jgi:hypothetical protein
MVCAGYLDYEPGAATYSLSEEHAFLLASEGTDHFMGGLFCMAPVLPRRARWRKRSRSGGGVLFFEDFGRRHRGARSDQPRAHDSASPRNG